MKLGVLTLWTNGMSSGPTLSRALAPRASSKRDEVALLAGVPDRASRVETPETRKPTSKLDDVLAADAKPLFAVDDLAYAMPSKPPPPPRSSRRRTDGAATKSSSERSKTAKPRRRASSRSHA